MDTIDHEIPQQVRRIEAALAEHDIKIREFLIGCEVSRSTWQRWKKGRNLPYWQTWQRVLAAAPAGRKGGRR